MRRAFITCAICTAAAAAGIAVAIVHALGQDVDVLGPHAPSWKR